MQEMYFKDEKEVRKYQVKRVIRYVLIYLFLLRYLR